MDIEKIGSEVRKTVTHVGETVDKVGEKRVRRWEGFSFTGIEKSIKRILLTAGVAVGVAWSMQAISQALMVARICKAVEFVFTIIAK